MRVFILVSIFATVGTASVGSMASNSQAVSVDVFGATERRGFAKSVVDSAIQLYTKGVVGEIFHVTTLTRWLPGISNIFPETALPWEERHERIAELLYKGAMRVGGISVKAMQFVGLRDDLPGGYRLWFSKAQEDTNLASSPEYVQALLLPLRSNLSWEERPFKSASIAQVHRGKWDGQPAIIKVQHAHVREEYLGDLATMAELGKYVDKYKEAKGAAVMLGAIAEKLRPQVDAETNFEIEARNQMRVRANFGQEPDVVVAKIFHSKQNALVMEQLQGQTAAEVVKAWKDGETVDLFNSQQREMVYKAFAEMVFLHRFFQMDAHPGNFMALGPYQVALLDFGQCSELSQDQYDRLLHFCNAAPLSQEGTQNSSNMAAWLQLIGVNVSEDQAQATAELLIFGGKSSMFPVTEGMAPEAMPFLFILLYLSRFENTAAGLRQKLFEDEPPDHFAVLRAFKTAASGCSAM
eukprot:TRINITY_DN25790_c0_g2_i2.p1 TRINITY_DN25790_c0_g2~~TRINITY_DN25790_c0_g2_i2.p1  ORF type:complete len:466 (+),score=89.32 TRINITY_DN25790_c0_g2_i2:154-1551(+)